MNAVYTLTVTPIRTRRRARFGHQVCELTRTLRRPATPARRFAFSTRDGSRNDGALAPVCLATERHAPRVRDVKSCGETPARRLHDELLHFLEQHANCREIITLSLQLRPCKIQRMIASVLLFIGFLSAPPLPTSILQTSK